MVIRWRYYVDFTVFLVITFGMLGAVSGLGSGYIGCYPVGAYLQRVFLDPRHDTSTVDECLLLCRNDLKAYASISGHTCFCSISLPSGKTIQIANDDQCNEACSGDSQETCGGLAHYSVFSTTSGICLPLMAPVNGGISRILFRVGRNVTFSCLPGYDLIGPIAIQCSQSERDNEGAIWSGHVPVCELAANNQTSDQETDGTSSAPSPQGWLRIVIDVVLIVAGSSLIIIIFFAVRSCRRSPTKVRSLTTREDFSIPDCAMVSTLGSKQSPTLINRSYRNFSLSTLERDAESSWQDGQDKPDGADNDTATWTASMTTVTESGSEIVDATPRMRDKTCREKVRGDDGSGSFKTERSFTIVSSLADFFRPERPEIKTPTASASSTNSPDVPKKPTKSVKPLNPDVEYASVKPRCKSAYIPSVQKLPNVKEQPARKSGIYCSTAKIASRWHVKKSTKVEQEGFDVMDDAGPETPKSKPQPDVPEKPSKSVKHLNPTVESASVKPRCKSSYIPSVQKMKKNPMFHPNLNKGNTSHDKDGEESFHVRDEPARRTDINCSTAEMASGQHVKRSVKVDQEGYAVMGGAGPKSRRALLPRQKLPNARNHACFSMKELE